jgi:hypothetical protein
MQVLTLTSAVPVYLPYDVAPIPFGDPFNDVTITSSTTAVVTVTGYAATSGDQVMFSVIGSNSLASGITAGTNYFVISPSGNTFSISSTKGGSAVATTTSNSAVNQVVVHLVSNQVDGTVQPFKPGASVVVLNLGSGTATLQGAPDAAAPTPGNYAAPQGPGTYTQIASIASGAAVVAVLNADWIKASGGGLVLLQN